jgi:hypothetical protein
MISWWQVPGSHVNEIGYDQEENVIHQCTAVN